MSSAWIVFRKELIDVLRDRRTLIFMMVIPTLAIPLLMWIMSDAMSYFMEKLARKQVEVLVINADSAPDLVKELRQRSNPMGTALHLANVLEQKGLGEKELSMVKGEGPEAFARLLDRLKIEKQELRNELRKVIGPMDTDLSPTQIISQAFPPNFHIITDLGQPLAQDQKQREQTLTEAVRTNQIAAAVVIPKDYQTKLQQGQGSEIIVYYLETSDQSKMALKGLKGILRAVDDQLVAQRLAQKGLPEQFANPIQVQNKRLPGPGILVKLMSQLLPYMILLFAFLGAMYPAIDLGAGEKERGTLETLLVAPVSRISLVIGKFGVILVAALISALLATFSLSISLQLGVMSSLSLLSGTRFSFSVLEALTALLMIIPVSCIFSALMLALSIFAKSFKEGQSYAGPLQLVIILPALASFLPGVKLDWMTASLPLVNVTLALKEIFTGNLDQHWPHVGVIFLSTSLYAGLLLWFAAWWFRREQVLFRS